MPLKSLHAYIPAKKSKYLENKVMAIRIRRKKLSFNPHVHGKKRRCFHISFPKIFLFFLKVLSFR